MSVAISCLRDLVITCVKMIVSYKIINVLCSIHRIIRVLVNKQAPVLRISVLDFSHLLSTALLIVLLFREGLIVFHLE